MGTDAHLANKSKSIKATLSNGQTITVVPMTFLCRASDLDPIFFGSPESRRRHNLRQARIARIDQVWGGEGPEYIVVCSDEPHDGYTVIRQSKGRSVLVYDTDTLGDRVGILCRKGGRWTVLSDIELTRLAGKMLRAMSSDRQYTIDECAAILGVSLPICEQIGWRLRGHKLIEQTYDPARRTTLYWRTPQSHAAEQSEELSAYWADVRLG